MGYWNSQFTGHMIDFETYPQDHSNLHPKPGIFYGTVANYPQPNFHPAVADLMSAHNINYQHMPEHHDSAFYVMPPYNSIQPQPPAMNLDLSVAAPSSHYNPHLAPPSSIRDFSLEVSQGARDELSLSLTQRMVGVPTDSYGRNMQYMDEVRGSFKRNVEAIPANNLYHPASVSVAPISSNALTTGRSAESGVPSVNAAYFMPPEYGGNDPTPRVENGICPSTRNRPGSVLAHSSNHSSNHINQGNYVTSPIPLSGNPWFNQHFGANNGDIGMYAWTQVPELPFVCASASGACVEMGNMHIRGHQPTTGSPSSYGFLHPSIPQGRFNSYHPPQPPVQGVRGYEVNFPPRVAPSQRSISAISVLNNGTNPFHDVADAGPLFLASVPQTGFRFYQPHLRETMPGSNAGRHNLPHLRVLPEDEVAILEIPRHHEAGDSIDHHVDMRLDIDHMSYEELLALGERIGSVGTGLPEEFIRNNLKTRTFTSTSRFINLEETPSLDEQIEFCVICQTDYKDGETNGIIDCGHEYHHECIKKWLLEKNSCPICKSTALSGARKDK